jgi:hypothetical protein
MHCTTQELVEALQESETASSVEKLNAIHYLCKTHDSITEKMPTYTASNFENQTTKHIWDAWSRQIRTGSAVYVCYAIFPVVIVLSIFSPSLHIPIQALTRLDAYVEEKQPCKYLHSVSRYTALCLSLDVFQQSFALSSIAAETQSYIINTNAEREMIC